MNRHLQEADRLLRSGSFEEAAEHCRKSLRMNRDAGIAMRMLADCHYNLGVRKLGEGLAIDRARAEFRRAFELDPTHAEAANNLGATFVHAGQPEAALEWLRKAAAAAPREHRYLVNLASALVLVQDLDEASRVLQSLARINPSNAGAYLLTEALLVPEVTPDPGYPARIRPHILAKLERLRAEPAPVSDPLELSASYFPLSYQGLPDVEIAKALASAYLAGCPSLEWTAPHVWRRRPRERRIRLGLASRFFRNHSIGNTSRGLFELIDRERFEVIAIRLEPSREDETARIIDAAADRVVTLPGDARSAKGNLEKARAAIAELELDILFYQEIGLEPLSYFLAFARLAPLQLTSFGHPDTTGIPNVDCYLSSTMYEMQHSDEEYSERLVTIAGAGTLAYYHRPARPAGPAARDELALSSGDRVYFCPQALQKVQPAMDEAFLEIVSLDPHARIVLIDLESSRRRLLEERMRRLTPTLADRVRFVERTGYDRFLARIAAADVILDTIHFNGYNTTLEAFAMGVPVVTLPGRLQRSRHGHGMYQAMGFTELIATDVHDYARKAVKVATDPAYRETCARRIGDLCGVLFENEGFIRAVESALETLLDEAVGNSA